MRRRSRIIFLAFLALLLLLWVCRESGHFYSEVRHLDLPRQETREPLGRKAHGWMNVRDLALFYGVPEETVFAVLNIEPAPGDEELPLKDLAHKYEKSSAEVEEALEILDKQQPSRGGQSHG